MVKKKGMRVGQTKRAMRTIRGQRRAVMVKRVTRKKYKIRVLKPKKRSGTRRRTTRGGTRSRRRRR